MFEVLTVNMIHTPGLKALHKTVFTEHINPSLFTRDGSRKKTIWHNGHKMSLPGSLACENTHSNTRMHTHAHTAKTHEAKSHGTGAFKTECHISL